jgi:hypothetical protein
MSDLKEKEWAEVLAAFKNFDDVYAEFLNKYKPQRYGEDGEYSHTYWAIKDLRDLLEIRGE